MLKENIKFKDIFNSFFFYFRFPHTMTSETLK